MISGFVMVYASEPLYARTGGPSTFFMHRVIRIVPLYWLVTGLYLLIAVIIPAFDKGYSFNMVAASLFFIPYMKPEGVMQPIVGQGWTLNYEMMFYVIFALAVVGSRQVAVAIALSTLVGACIAGWALQPLPPMMAFWTNPIILEFTYGMLIAVAWREGFKLPQAVAFGLIVAGPLLFFFLSWIGSADPTFRALTWGGPAAILVAGATLADFSLKSWIWHALAAIGNASYALYLFHPLLIRCVLYFARWLGFDLTVLAWSLFFVAVPVAIISALAISLTV